MPISSCKVFEEFICVSNVFKRRGLMYQIDIVMSREGCPLADKTVKSDLELSIISCNPMSDDSIVCLVQIVDGHPTTVAEFFRSMREDEQVSNFEMVTRVSDQAEFIAVLHHDRPFIRVFKGSFTFLKPPVHVEGGSR